MFKKLLFLLLLFTSTFSFGQTLIPDTNFEQFLVDQGIDSNGITGDILNADAQAVNDLNLNRNDIVDFTGLEAFVNVITLDLGNNLFTELPLNNLVLLEELVFNNNTVLVNLDLSSNVNLKIIDMRANGGTNTAPITTIDFSANINLTSIHIYNFGALENFILPNTTTLNNLNIYSRHDLTVDLGVFDNLETLSLGVGASRLINAALPTVKTSLTYFRLFNGSIPTIDLSAYIALETIDFTGTGVVTFIPPQTPTLTDVKISIHNISTVSFNGVINLQNLTIRSGNPTSLQLDITDNLLLEELTLVNNKMTDVNITQNTELISLDISNNDLTTINTEQNTKLISLNAEENLITNLDLSANVSLKTILLRENLLPELILTDNIELTRLDLGENKLPNLDVTTNTLLRDLEIDTNLFTTTGLDLTQNTELEDFTASFNQIESLDISQNSMLEKLIIDNNLFSGNDILNQYYQNFINSGRFISDYYELIVHHNNLTGLIPDFSSIVDNQTFRFKLEIEDNNFHFEDFEAIHDQYLFFFTNFSPNYTSSFFNYFATYNYAGQDKVNPIENLTPNAGGNITLTTTVRGTQNHYKWFKDGMEITDAPDAPEYTITDLNTCDNGVYHSEITSDLIPFENGNPPGTSGKNLLLVRNEITLTVNATKDCVTLNMPLVDVPINSGIEWNENPGACGYKITVINVATGTAIQDNGAPITNRNVGNITLFNFDADLLANTEISVLITPYFEDGDFGGCAAESFTTSTATVATVCTTLQDPASNVNIPVDIPEISWLPANAADAYKLTITSTSGINNLPETNVGNVLTYPFGNDFQLDDVVTVTIVPTNAIGDATGPCTSESFTIVSAMSAVPACTLLNSPTDGAIDILENTDISWDAVTDATGYEITISSTSGNNNITAFDNGNNTTYNPPANFDNDDVVTVTITPFIGSTPAASCSDESFTIVSSALAVPDCTLLNSPTDDAIDILENTDISWDAVTDATGYEITISSTSGNNNITSFDNGNNTTYNPPADFDSGDVVTVTITPFIGSTPAASCSDESFTVVSSAPAVPACTLLNGPTDGAIDILENTDISWDAVTGATGYEITISSTSGNNNITSFDNGNNTTYNPPADFDSGDVVTVTITPFIGSTPAASCSDESFTIASGINSTYVDLSAPAGGDGLSWATAFQEIQSAVDIASPNATIFIAEGIYQPLSTIRINIPLIIKGGYPAGGGIQDISTHITQVQGDFFPTSFLFNVFEITVDSPTTIEGIRITKTRSSITAASNITINQVQFEEFEVYGIRLGNNIETATLSNCLFANSIGIGISENSSTLRNVFMNDVIFENGTGRAMLLNSDGITNIDITNCAIRNYTVNDSSIHVEAQSTNFTNLIAENNIINSGALIFYSNETGILTIKDSNFNNNTGSNTECLQAVDGSVVLDNTDFINNSSTAAFSTISLTRTNLNATNCKFNNNSGVGVSTEIVNVRDFGTDIIASFDNCEFKNNQGTSVSATLINITNEIILNITNSLFDNNNLHINGRARRGATISNNTFQNYNTTRLILTLTGVNTVDAVFENNIFQNNLQSLVGIANYNNLRARNNTYLDETSLRVAFVTTASFKNDYYRGNSINNEFLGLDGVNATLENVIMISEKTNSTHKVVDSDDDTSLNIINSTFSAVDFANTHITVDFDDDLPSTIQNSIIWSGDSSTSGLVGITSNLTIEHSLIKNENPTGTGNLDGNLVTNAPIFVNPALFDFRMQDCSPTVNLGLNTYSSETTDLLGNPRVFETIIDMGAYELQSNKTTTCTVVAVPDCTNLTAPLNNDINVATTLDRITWQPVTNATKYSIVITGTANNNITTETTDAFYVFPDVFLNEEIVSVTITPINGTTEPVATCATESFTIVAAIPVPTAPDCTNLTAPLNNDINVATTLDRITWQPVTNATKYSIVITGTANNNITTETTDAFYVFPDVFLNEEIVSITITPINGTTEPVTTCATENFTIVAAIPVPTAPDCTNLTVPLNNDINIATTLDRITWQPVTNATKYSIVITGTANNNITTETTDAFYVFPGVFLNEEIVSVTITPINGTTGPVTTCATESFTIAAETTAIPDCTALTNPMNGSIDVPADTNISWAAVANAVGYRVRVTGSGNTDNNIFEIDVTTGTSYEFLSDFNSGETITVNITPFNSANENIVGCPVETFTITEEVTTPTLLNCSNLTAPINGASDVPINLEQISWEEVTNAEGYIVAIRTETGETILESQDLGILTTFLLPENLPYQTTIFVSIIPYNSTITEDITCNEQSFVTVQQEEPEVEDQTLYGFSPNGDGIRDFWSIDGIEAYPENVVTIYSRWGDAVFEINNYDNQSNVFSGTANKKTNIGASNLPSGTYFFNIQIAGETTLSKTQGFLVLKR